jgi:hypothetical protein
VWNYRLYNYSSFSVYELGPQACSSSELTSDTLRIVGNFFKLVYWGVESNWVHSALWPTSRPILPDPDDYDDGGKLVV